MDRGHILEAIESANQNRTRLPNELLALEGMSSRKVRIFLNEVCSLPECRYLEIGAWKGSTVLSASYGNSGYFQTIDNFSEFGGPKNELLANQLRFEGVCRFNLIESNVWEFIPAPESVNVFFYDGRHTRADHIRAFAHFNQAFTDPFLAIIDDWQFHDVQIGTFTAFQKFQYGDDFWELDREQGWWNGLAVALLRKPHA